MNQNLLGCCLIHWQLTIGNVNNPRGMASHYLGNTKKVIGDRFKEHQSKAGARITKIAVERGRSLVWVKGLGMADGIGNGNSRNSTATNSSALSAIRWREEMQQGQQLWLFDWLNLIHRNLENWRSLKFWDYSSISPRFGSLSGRYWLLVAGREPNCFRKNGSPASLRCSWIARSHSILVTRVRDLDGRLSPPAIIQSRLGWAWTCNHSDFRWTIPPNGSMLK